MPKKELLGGYERTGVYLSQDDFDELKQVIKKAHVKDATIKRVGGLQFGGDVQRPSKIMPAPTMGSLGIQDFVRRLVKNYGFKDSDRVLYGVNNKREILRWMSPKEVVQHNEKKPGRKTI